MGAERPVASCSGAAPMQVSRHGTLLNQTVAKGVRFAARHSRPNHPGWDSTRPVPVNALRSPGSAAVPL